MFITPATGSLAPHVDLRLLFDLCAVPAASVIVSTYNSPDYLHKVLASLEVQDNRDFEVIVADDGSDRRTAAVLESWEVTSSLPIHHVWHEDRGFRKTEILNHAIVAAKADYLIFTDGDCLLRRDFVALHLRSRQENHFLSGGYFKLGRELSQQITEADIRAQRCFSLDWLRQRGHPASIKNLKLTGRPAAARLLNALTPTRPTWNGHNASTWKALALATNGFDTRMKYGGEDREFGERLRNAGVRPVQVRYSAICLHLDHDRGYVTEEMITANRRIRDATIRGKRVRTDHGIAPTSNDRPA